MGNNQIPQMSYSQEDISNTTDFTGSTDLVNKYKRDA